MQMEAGAPLRHASAPGLWERVAEAIWSSGEPAVFFRDSARFLGQETGRSLSGGFVFLTGTSAPSSAINLCALARSDEILHVTRILVAAGEAALPEEDAYRPLHISITGLAGVLMSKGIAYDSDAGRSMAALLAAQVSGAAHLASADMAKTTGSFERFSALEKSFLQLIKDKLSALSGTYHMQKGVARRVLQPAGDHPLAREARVLWEKAYMLGKESGFRHAHLTVSDTDEGMQMVLNAQTRDIAPETSLVRFEGYFSDTLENAALYGKKLNPMVPPALAHLGYSSSEIDDIYFYAVGHGTLLDAPAIHHDALKKKGFHQAALAALEAALKSAQHIRYVFNKWTLGEDFCRHSVSASEKMISRRRTFIAVVR
jgi:ribonucleoside-diphosphate reductase alpha chain